jgi:protein ImuB
VAVHRPVVVLAANRVVACSAAARVEGIRRGLRKREAQGRCPGLVVVEDDPARDARAFEPVVAAVEELAPGVEVVRPGSCALAARGPSRYFGSEAGAAERIVEHLAQSCTVEAQIGIADGVFAAGIAARTGRLVPIGGTADFLAGIDIGALDRPELADLLRRLGVGTLGAFAALPGADVLGRFGADAALAHRLAGGRDERPLVVRQPPPDLDVAQVFDEPLERVDAAAFAAKQLAERLHARLAGHGLACTRLGIAALTEYGEELYRTWRHDGLLTAAAIGDRVRWQLDGWLARRPSVQALPAAGQAAERGEARRPSVQALPAAGQAAERGEARRPSVQALPAAEQAAERGETLLAAGRAAERGEAHRGQGPGGIVRLWLNPDGVVEYGGFQLGLWGDAGEARDRAHRALARVQGLLGPDAVLTAVLGGGRDPDDQIRLVPWGDERISEERPPWPGRIPAPSPATVPPCPLPVVVLDTEGAPVGVDARLALTGIPAQVDGVEITGWAGPWPVDERWWAPEEASRRVRFQVCLADGRALLLVLESGSWSIRGVYD